MAWRRPGDKPLSEPMMVRLLTHICVTQPQWVNGLVSDGTKPPAKPKCWFIISGVVRHPPENNFTSAHELNEESFWIWAQPMRDNITSHFGWAQTQNDPCLICNIYFEITLLKLLPHFPGDNELMRMLTHRPLLPYICVMACHLSGATPLPTPMLPCYQLDAWEQTSVNFESKLKNFSFIKLHFKLSSAKWRPYCPGPWSLVSRRRPQWCMSVQIMIKLHNIFWNESLGSSSWTPRDSESLWHMWRPLKPVCTGWE